jgi:branched-chain amino acid transport system permease protein
MEYVSLTISGITLGSIYALVALGFNLVYRTVDVLDFGQGDKVVLGGLVALTLTRDHIPLALVFVIIMAGGLLAGVLYQTFVVRPSLRRGPDVAIIATVGALLVMSSGHVLIYGATAQPFPAIIGGTVKIGSAEVDAQDFVVWGVVAVAVTVVTLFLSRSRYGKAMLASAADPMAAGAVGIDVRQMRVIAAAAAFSLAALAGVLIAPITLAGGTVGPTLTLKAFTAAVLGGLSSTFGVVVGALLLGLFEMLVGAQVPFAYRDPLIFAILIVVLLVRPAGLFGVRERLA